MLLLTSRREGQKQLGRGLVPLGLLKQSPYLEHQEWKPQALPPLYFGKAKEVQHPTGLHRSVDSLFQVLSKKFPASKVLATASLLIYHSGFGLVIYKHPRPGVVHVYNKKFGGRPNVLCTEPLDQEELRRADNEFV